MIAVAFYYFRELIPRATRFGHLSVDPLEPRSRPAGRRAIGEALETLPNRLDKEFGRGRLAVTGDQEVVGKIGRVTGTIAPRSVGEVMIPIRGGSEAFNAHASDAELTIETAARVIVVEYYPPRTVVVEKL